MARLGDYFVFIRNGANIKQDKNKAGYPITRIETISNRSIDLTKMGYADVFDCTEYKDYLLKNGDILMSHINSQKHLGKCALCENLCETVIHGMNLLCLRPKSDVIIPKFALYYFNSNAFLSTLSNIIKPSVNQASFTVKNLKELDFPNTPISKQSQIVYTLQKLDDVLDEKQQQLSKLDELVKARFVEMFGDPSLNPNKWKKMKLKDIAVGKLSYGSGASAVQFDGSVRYVRITDITYDGELNNDVKSPNKLEEKYLLNHGDILFARSGATVGKTFLYDKNKYGKCLYAGYLIKLVPNNKIVMSEYVYYYTKTDYYGAFIKNVQRAAAQPNINAQEYGDLKICIPPIELQNEFAVFVEQVEKSKKEIQQSLEKLETLKKSLMQEYFG